MKRKLDGLSPEEQTALRSEWAKRGAANSQRLKDNKAKAAKDRAAAAEVRRRQVSLRFTPPTREAILGYARFYDGWVAHVAQGHGLPFPQHADLTQHPAHGPVFGAAVVRAPVDTWEGGNAITFAMVGRKEDWRYIDQLGFLVLRVLTLFVDEMPAMSGKSAAGRPEHLPILAEGFTLARLLVNADGDEEARLHIAARPLDLGPWSLERVPGNPWPDRERHHAIERALRFYEKNARRWALADTITASQYEALLKGSFRLYDAKNAAHLLRPVGLGITTP